MKAAVLNDYEQPLSIEEVRIDAPRAREVKVRIGATGVCHSDYHLIKGEWRYGVPMILGHEAAGVVEEVGPDVTSVTPGDHAILSFRPSCGSCRLCTIGRSVMCEGYTGNRFMMHDGTARVHRNGEDLLVMGRMGSFAEYVVMPAEQVIPVRKDVPMEVLALIGCAVTTGVGAVINAAKVEPGASVAVIGCGGVGLNVIQGCRIAGAATIIAVDIAPQKLDLAAAFGATHQIDAGRQDVVSTVRRLTHGGADYAFEVIGNTRTIRQAYDSIHRGGTAVVVGEAAPGDEVKIDAFTLPMMEKTLKGSFYGSTRPRVDMPKLIDLYVAGKLKLDELITRTVRLDEVNEAFAAMERGEVARSVIAY